MPATLRVRITAKRQATFPAAALKVLGVKPGDYLELTQAGASWRLAPAKVDFAKLGPLQHRILENHLPFDQKKWRDARKDYGRLRD